MTSIAYTAVLAGLILGSTLDTLLGLALMGVGFLLLISLER